MDLAAGDAVGSTSRLAALEQKLRVLETRFLPAHQNANLGQEPHHAQAIKRHEPASHQLSPAQLGLHDPTLPHILLKPPPVSSSARLSSNAPASAPARPPASTWEGDKSRAILALDEKLRQLQQPQIKQAPGPLSQQANGHGMEDSSKENTNPTLTSRDIAGQLNLKHAQSLPLQPSSVGPTLSEQEPLMGTTTSVTGRTHLGKTASVFVNTIKTTTVPNTGIWEHSKANALLVLEREKSRLAEQLEQYAHLDAIHARAMVEVHARHARALKDAQGDAGRKLKALRKSAAATFAHQWLARRLTKGFLAWLWEAKRSRRLQKAEHVWNLRFLEPIFHAWNRHALGQRRKLTPEHLLPWQREVLLAWQLQARALRRLRCLGERCRLLHLRYLTSAWQERAAQLASKHRAAQQAVRHHQRQLLRRATWALHSYAVWAPGAQQELQRRLVRIRLRLTFQSWVKLTGMSRKLVYMQSKSRMLRALCEWKAITHARTRVRQRTLALRTRWGIVRQQQQLCYWHVWARYRGHLRQCEASLVQLSRRRALSSAFHQLSLGVRASRAEHILGRVRLGSTLSAWHRLTQHQGRARRVAAAAAANRVGHLLERSFHAWCLLGAWRHARLLTEDNARMQGYVSTLQSELEEARAEESGARTRAAAAATEAQQLRAEAARGLVMAAVSGDGMLLDGPLAWQSVALPGTSISSHQPLARARHAALALPGVQQQQQQQGMEDPQAAATPGASATILVYGGVRGNEWLNDITYVTITHADMLEPRVSVAPLPLDLSALPGASLPGPRRDSSCCAAGPSSFMVIGGFDGQAECMDILYIQVRPAAGANPGRSPYLLGHVSAVTQHSGRSPAGRSHHSACYHEAGRSVLVWGGYSSQSGGHLDELWVLNLDTHEWWQPHITGTCPPKRRGHVACIVGGRMLVHGGYDGTRHLSDLWALDLETWAWEELTGAVQGTPPPPRRGHACTLVGRERLLMHGGFDGTTHLGDTYVLDVASLLWTQLHVGGGAHQVPAPRALHTLTSLGTTALLLGGSGPLGSLPLGSSIHLLESPPLRQGLAQQQRLCEALSEVSRLTSHVGELQAQLRLAHSRLEEGGRKLQAVEARASALVVSHNRLVSGMDALRAEVATEQAARRAAEESAQAARLSAGAAERRLTRARQGGREVAEAAGALSAELEESRASMQQLEAEVEEARHMCASAQAAAASLQGERMALRTQLAAANNEVALLRALLLPGSSSIRPPETPPAAPVAPAGSGLSHVSAHITLHQQQQQATVVGAGGGDLAAQLRAELQAANAREAALQQQLQQLRLRPEASQPGHGVEEGGDPTPSAPGSVLLLGAPSSGPAGVLGSQLEGALRELAQGQARAATAQLQVELLEREVAMARAELASSARALALERGEAAAARETAQQATQALHAALRSHQAEVERLQEHIKLLTAQRWVSELDASQGQGHTVRALGDGRLPPPGDHVLLAALKHMGASPGLLQLAAQQTRGHSRAEPLSVPAASEAVAAPPPPAAAAAPMQVTQHQPLGTAVTIVLPPGYALTMPAADQAYFVPAQASEPNAAQQATQHEAGHETQDKEEEQDQSSLERLQEVAALYELRQQLLGPGPD